MRAAFDNQDTPPPPQGQICDQTENAMGLPLFRKRDASLGPRSARGIDGYLGRPIMADRRAAIFASRSPRASVRACHPDTVSNPMKPLLPRPGGMTPADFSRSSWAEICRRVYDHGLRSPLPAVILTITYAFLPMSAYLNKYQRFF